MGRSAAVAVAVVAAAGAAALLVTPTGGGGINCDLNATTANFTSQLTAATGGQTLCLAAGTYTPAEITMQKSSTVTIRPGEGVAKEDVRMTPTIGGTGGNNASNMTFQGMTIIGMSMNDDPTNIDFRDNNIVERVNTIRMDTMSSTGIDFDSNYIGNANINEFYGCVSSCGPDGTLSFQVAGPTDVGITVSNNLFTNEELQEYTGATDSDWEADGILQGANGLVIENNEFRGFTQGACGSCQHTDPLQMFGSSNSVIRGNWFHDNAVAAAIMAPDDADSELVENNVIDQSASDDRTINFGGDVGSTVNHNTLVGSFMLKDDKDGPAGTGTIVTNNIITNGMNREAGHTTVPATYTYNLAPTCSYCGGSNNINGQPTFEGGGSPFNFPTLGGYALTALSLGKGNASDSTDRGAPIP